MKTRDDWNHCGYDGKNYRKSTKSAKKYKKRQKVTVNFITRTLALLALASCWMPSFGADSGLIGAPIPKPEKYPLNYLYNMSWSDRALCSTPEEPASRKDSGVEETSSIDVKVDGKGKVTSLRFGRLSNSQSRDVLTLWAAATCPPIEKPKGLKEPITLLLDNAPWISPSTKFAEDCRSILTRALTNEKKAEYIAIPLIPVSLAEARPQVFSMNDLCTPENLVGLSTAIMPKKKAWNLRSANQWLHNGNVAAFLFEWSNFYSKHPNASKEQYLAFAKVLQKKYKKLLKEGGGPTPPSQK